MDFAILRAGFGKESSQIDVQFERNYSECKRLGIPCGAYWYSYAKTAAEAEQEAAVCLSALAGKQFEYPIAFDIEEKASLQNADALCQAFCSALESAGYYAAIYTFKSALESCIASFLPVDPEWTLDQIVFSNSLKEQLSDIVSFCKNKEKIINDWELYRFMKGKGCIESTCHTYADEG